MSDTLAPPDGHVRKTQLERKYDRPKTVAFAWLLNHTNFSHAEITNAVLPAIDAAFAAMPNDSPTLTAEVARLTEQHRYDGARIRILARKASASGGEIDQELLALNREEDAWAGQNPNPETKILDDRAVLLAAAKGAREALRLTREYIGVAVLPAIEGWTWFDADQALAAAIVQAEATP